MKLHRISLRKQIHSLFIWMSLLVIIAFLAFYATAFHALSSKEERYMYSIMAQVAQKTEDITASVDLLTRAVCNAPTAISLLQETEANQKWRYKQALNTQISDLARSNSSITNIVLLDNAGRVYSFNDQSYSLVNEFNASYGLFSPDNQLEGFVGPLYSKGNPIPYYANISSVYESGVPASEAGKIGTCLVIGTCEPLYSACLKAASSGNSLLMIFNRSGQVLVRNGEENKPLEAAILTSVQEDTSQMFSAHINGQKYLISWQPLDESTGWCVVSAVPYQDILAGLLPFHLLALLFFLFLIITYFLLVRRLTLSITLPLEKLVRFIKNGPYYNLHNHVELDETNELGELANHINLMLDQINELTRTSFDNQARLYEIELANIRSRLQALQSQINPHFLYNTLDAICGLAYLKQTDDIPTAVSALSAIMRYSIKGDETVTVAQELDCVRKYLQIIHIRFPNRFTFHIAVPEEILSCPMPRFLLQPLVENAVFHGLEPKPGAGTLTLSCERDADGVLRFTCSDDGIGIPPSELAALSQQLQNSLLQNNRAVASSRQGLGLCNIHLRIRLLYGSPYGLSLESEQGRGTSIRMELPVSPGQTS